MARKPRLFVPGATYHVYCRVVRGMGATYRIVMVPPIRANGYHVDGCHVLLYDFGWPNETM